MVYELTDAIEPTPKQRASIGVINGCLAGRIAATESTLARCAEIILLLSEGEFDSLAKNILQFAHNVAVTEDARLKGALNPR
jgi:hypothetical protein